MWGSLWSAPDPWTPRFTATQAQSGRGLPHCKTLTRPRERHDVAEPVECASPLALWLWREERKDGLFA
jgi:hypothetical protein